MDSSQWPSDLSRTAKDKAKAFEGTVQEGCNMDAAWRADSENWRINQPLLLTKEDANAVQAHLQSIKDTNPAQVKALATASRDEAVQVLQWLQVTQCREHTHIHPFLHARTHKYTLTRSHTSMDSMDAAGGLQAERASMAAWMASERDKLTAQRARQSAEAAAATHPPPRIRRHASPATHPPPRIRRTATHPPVHTHIIAGDRNTCCIRATPGSILVKITNCVILSVPL